MRTSTPKYPIIILLSLSVQISALCIHNQFAKDSPKYFLSDLAAGDGGARLLTSDQVGRIRIFADYGQLTLGTQAEINTIKRVTNITANYFYNVLNVTRLPRLYYPKNAPLQCNNLKINEKYVTEGVIGDIGIIVGSQSNHQAVYIAKSLTCAFLQSDKRPIWGILIWNILHLKYDQVGFQEMVYVANHQLNHILGFSASMYEMYPKGNPLVIGQQGDYYLNSTRIQQQILAHFGCNNSKGIPLQDQDGTLIASHWERKVVGNQFMIASGKKGAFLSRFSLALLDSTGWYASVNYSYSQPSNWGQGRGCNFLNIDNCQGTQFCQDSSFGCDWEATAIGKCNTDIFSGSCKVSKYYTNTICIDQNYGLKNLNSKLNAFQAGGSGSRCFNSDYRQQGLLKSKLDYRCYQSVCSSSGLNIYIMVGPYILVCRRPQQIINAPTGLNGTLVCPKNFSNICKNKKTCSYHCNKNGICINGKCLCTGATQLTSSCLDISIYISPVGQVGGLLNSVRDPNSLSLILPSTLSPQPSPSNPNSNVLPLITLNFKQRKQYSINSKCIQGTVEDKIFGDCLRCKDVYNCQRCNQGGCLICDDGRMPTAAGRCY